MLGAGVGDGLVPLFAGGLHGPEPVKRLRQAGRRQRVAGEAALGRNRLPGPDGLGRDTLADQPQRAIDGDLADLGRGLPLPRPCSACFAAASATVAAV